jgi:2-amino-4-hydroxy-6-hydroxymethyldihydropteridine diphosphokinase
MTQCWIALGANLGPTRDTFEHALELLGRIPQSQLGPVSAWHETVAVGDPSGPAYLNAAAGVQTDLEPLALLDQLQAVELQLGRVRERRWGPRTLDLDLLLYGHEVIESPRLTVPHPHLWYRRFVLDPLAEIAGDVIHPERGLSIRELRERLLRRPFVCALAGGASADRAQIVQQLAPQFPQVDLHEWSAADHAPIPAIIAWLGPSPSGVAWTDLPAIARLDLTAFPGPAVGDLRDVLHAALG